MKLQLSFAIVLLAGSIGTAFSQTDVTSATYPDLFTPASDVTVVTPLTGLLTVNLGGTKTGALGTYWDATANGGAAIGINAGLIVLPLADTGAQVALKDNSLQFNLSNNPSSVLGALGVGTSLNLSWSATAAFDKSGAVLNLKPNSTYRVSFDVDTGGNLLNSTLGIVPTFGVSLLDANGTAIGSSQNTTLVNILGLQLLNVLGAPQNTGRAVVSFTTGATVPSGPAQIKFTGSSVLPVTLLNIGANFAKVSNLSVAYLSPYQQWIENSGVDPSNWDPTADPDGDGRDNLAEFAVDSNPAVADSSNLHYELVDSGLTGEGQDIFVLTFPVRTGATFGTTGGNGGSQLSSLTDGVKYEVQGSFDLVNWTQAVSEVSANSFITNTLTPLPSGWTYRSFRVPGQTSTTPKAFLRVKVN